MLSPEGFPSGGGAGRILPPAMTGRWTQAGGNGAVKTVPLHGKYAKDRVVLVDDADYDLVRQYRWRAREQSSRRGTTWGPWAETIIARADRTGRISITMHQLLTGWPLTDHADGNGLNNQRYNLRSATRAQNSHNRRPNTGHSSRFKGVSWNKRKRKWVAQIKVDGKNRHLGYFAREEDAAQAYAGVSLALQGEYAYAARNRAA